MALIDKIEMLGSAVENGIMTAEAATDLLVDLAGGRLTKVSALWTIENYRLMVDRGGESLVEDVRRAVEVMQAVRSAQTPEEYFAAHDAMVAEAQRQWQAAVERNRQRIRDDLRNGRGIFGRRPKDMPGSAGGED